MDDTTGDPRDAPNPDDEARPEPDPGSPGGVDPERPTMAIEGPERWEPWEPWDEWAAPAAQLEEPEAPDPKAASHVRPWHIALIGLASAVLGVALGVAITLTLLSDGEQAAAPTVTVVERIETRIVEVPADVPSTTAAEIARRVVPSIVVVEQGTLDAEGQFTRTGGGSGVVLDPDGHIVTNHHVVDGADAYRVTFADGRTVPAALIGSDPLTDLAVLSVEVQDLTPVSLGSTSDLAVGDTAFAVGNPLTLEGGPSMTSGVVSAFDRSVAFPGGASLVGMLQTDAPITRGSSGGALVDGQGLLIGITTAVGISDLGQEGIGFAIPVELVRRVVDEIIETGAISHAFLGIEGTTHVAEEADGSRIPAGIDVGAVVPGTAAESAGMMPGDIIVSYRGEPMTSMEQLVTRLRLSRVGDRVTLEILRDGETMILEMELLERPEGL